jgi:hypothetical protein
MEIDKGIMARRVLVIRRSLLSEIFAMCGCRSGAAQQEQPALIAEEPDFGRDEIREAGRLDDDIQAETVCHLPHCRQRRS